MDETSQLAGPSVALPAIEVDVEQGIATMRGDGWSVPLVKATSPGRLRHYRVAIVLPVRWRDRYRYTRLPRREDTTSAYFNDYPTWQEAILALDYVLLRLKLAEIIRSDYPALRPDKWVSPDAVTPMQDLLASYLPANLGKRVSGLDYLVAQKTKWIAREVEEKTLEAQRSVVRAHEKAMQEMTAARSAEGYLTKERQGQIDVEVMRVKRKAAGVIDGANTFTVGDRVTKSIFDEVLDGMAERDKERSNYSPNPASEVARFRRIAAADLRVVRERELRREFSLTKKVDALIRDLFAEDLLPPAGYAGPFARRVGAKGDDSAASTVLKSYGDRAAREDRRIATLEERIAALEAKLQAHIEEDHEADPTAGEPDINPPDEQISVP